MRAEGQVMMPCHLLVMFHLPCAFSYVPSVLLLRLGFPRHVLSTFSFCFVFAPVKLRWIHLCSVSALSSADMFRLNSVHALPIFHRSSGYILLAVFRWSYSFVKTMTRKTSKIRTTKCAYSHCMYWVP